eukprot:GFYU01003357.1.p1 GENE.GFYU01003357.1~~GFYU01003357.1.p1  ORF type:complete len:675 (+),score=253.52 GFYU01003357.1:344-2368(+)
MGASPSSCCGGESEDKNLDQGTGGGNPAQSPVKRECRDVFFLLLFIGFWIGMLVIGAVAFTKGDPARLVHGTDEYGNKCGMGVNADFPYLYYPDITSPKKKECIPQCWTKEVLDKGFVAGDRRGQYWDSETEVPLGGYCQPRRANPKTNDGGKYIKEKWGMFEGTALNCIPGTSQTSEKYAPYASTAVLKFCFPDALTKYMKNMSEKSNSTMSSGAFKMLESGGAAVGRAVSDIQTASWAIIVGMVVALLVSFGWMFLIKQYAKAFVWGTVFAVVFVSFAFTGLMYAESQSRKAELDANPGLPSSYSNKVKALEILGYIGFGISALLVIILIFLRKRISITAEIVREASTAVGRMPGLIFYPFITFLFLLGVGIWWITVAAFLASAGTEREYKLTGDLPAGDDGTRTTVEFDETMRYMILYHLFGLLWTVQFFLAMGEIVVAGAVANWYWAETGHDGRKKLSSESPVLDSFRMVGRYYLGSIAFGSLIIAIIQFIRLVLEYIDQQAKKYPENKFLKYTLCVLKCCFYLMEKCMKFINRNAYIMIAVYGESFCTSAKNAFLLIAANVLRVAAVNVIGDFLLFLGKISITCLCGLLGYGIISSLGPDAVSSVLFPTIIVVGGSYTVAAGFMNVYEMAIDTILLCFCKDCEDGGPNYCSQELKEVMGNAEQKPSTKE